MLVKESFIESGTGKTQLESQQTLQNQLREKGDKKEVAEKEKEENLVHFEKKTPFLTKTKITKNVNYFSSLANPTSLISVLNLKCFQNQKMWKKGKRKKEKERERESEVEKGTKRKGGERKTNRKKEKERREICVPEKKVSCWIREGYF